LHARLPDTPWRPLVESIGYSTGFLVVVLGRQQLFTENTLTPVLPILLAFEARTLRALARLWGLVLVANLAGCTVVALTLAAAPLFPPPIQDGLRTIAHHTVEATPFANFWRAIFAGWLIALMVWLLPSSEGGARPAIVTILTYMIAIGGFPHIVAGSVDTLYELFRGDISLGAAVLTFFLPTLCGNVLGGTLLVSFLSFGQVFADHVKDGSPTTR
jgi:formate/nitrite transporter FocA (FNT family)